MNSPTSTEESSLVFDTRDELFTQDVDSASDSAPDSNVSNHDDNEGNDLPFEPNHAGPTPDDRAGTRGPVAKAAGQGAPLPNFPGQAMAQPLVDLPPVEEPGIPASNKLQDLRAARVIPHLPAPRPSGKLTQGPDLLPTRPSTPPTPQPANGD